MCFSNFPWGDVTTIHISYHNGDHYNCVRLLNDTEEDVPCQPISHELKLVEPPPPTEEEKNGESKSQPPTAGNGEVYTEPANSSEIPTRAELLSYAH